MTSYPSEAKGALCSGDVPWPGPTRWRIIFLLPSIHWRQNAPIKGLKPARPFSPGNNTGRLHFQPMQHPEVGFWQSHIKYIRLPIEGIYSSFQKHILSVWQLKKSRYGFAEQFPPSDVRLPRLTDACRLFSGFHGPFLHATCHNCCAALEVRQWAPVAHCLQASRFQ